MKVLLAGATGVVGRAAVAQLLERGHSVIALARRRDSAATLAGQGAYPIVGDLVAWSTLDGRAPQVDVAVHLATAIPSDRSPSGPWADNDRVRLVGTTNLIRLAAQAGAERYVQQSVTRLYAPRGGLSIDESAPLAWDQPAHLRSAVQMEQIVRSLEQMSWVILRGGRLYGRGTRTTERLFAQARAGVMRLEGDGDHYISPVHPQDMARAVVLAVESLPGRTAYNVVDDEPLPQRRFFAAIRDLANPDAVLVETDPANPMPSRRCSNAKLRGCGFVPTYPTFRDGLAEMAAADQGWRAR